MFDRTTVPHIAPFGVYVFFMVVEDMLLRFGWSADDVRLLYAVKIVAVAAALWLFRRAYTELRWPSGTGVTTWITAIAAGIAVFVAWINLTAGWMVMGDAVGFDPRNDQQIDWPLVAIRLAGAALVVPLMEELFWRSFLLRWLENHRFQAVNPSAVRITSLLIVSVLFALAHSLWFAGLLTGIVYGLLYMRSGTLWAPIIAHAVTNGILGVWIVLTGNWGFW
ncbi:MAG: CAAX prenyl protease-related protein [Nitrosomonas sp.]|nr:MAG: CAAX prenyl protease-related protein [Nitrosomonas sp.]